MKQAMLIALAVVAASVLTGCGGGAPAVNYNLSPVIMLSPATANIQQGGRQQFSATVMNSVDDTVTWEVNGLIGGDTLVGTIDANGIYTAPAVVPTPPAVTVTAVLNAAPDFSGSSILTVTSVVFNNGSLKGNYVLSLKGTDNTGSSFYAVGAITADGQGSITGGEEDLNDISSGRARATSVAGNYTVGADGRGILNLSSSLGSFSYALALKALNNAGLNEMDNVVINASGTLEAQANGVSVPSGNYAFGYSGKGAGCPALNSIGIFGLAGGALNGTQDVNCSGTIAQGQALSGAYGSVDALGRGTGSFSASAGSSDLIYYVVSAGRYRFLSSDTGTVFLGSADLQTKPSFTASDFHGNYIIANSAITQTTLSNTLISISANAGTIPAGYLDVNATGNFSSENLTGAYSLNSNGYIAGSLNGLLMSYPFSMYLVSPTQAYYLDLLTTESGGGIVYQQDMVAAGLGKEGWAGSYATEQYGYFTAGGVISPGNSTSVSGQVSANGNGGLSGTLDYNDPTDIFPDLPLQGSYSIDPAILGRMTVKIASTDGTRNYIAYIVNQGRVQMLEIDMNITAAGESIRQF
jgi:hypothetical protein